jgi:hypothetical protein
VEWIVPPAGDRAPNPPDGYVVSFISFHERGFAAPASRFMRSLCHRYGVELHNFAPNAILQAATFVGVCEGYLGIPVNWDLWVHLFRAELFTQPTTEQRTRHAVRAGGMSLALRAQYKDDYIPCTMTTNNAGWELLTDKRRIPLRSASVRTPHLFHHGIPKVLVNPRSKGITSVRSTTTH